MLHNYSSCAIMIFVYIDDMWQRFYLPVLNRFLEKEPETWLVINEALKTI